MAAKLSQWCSNETRGQVSRWFGPWVVLLVLCVGLAVPENVGPEAIAVGPIASGDLDRVMPETFWESDLLTLERVLEGSSQSRTITAAVPEATPAPVSTLSDEDVALLNRVERTVEAIGPENVASTEWNKLLNDDTLPTGAAQRLRVYMAKSDRACVQRLRFETSPKLR